LKAKWWILVILIALLAGLYAVWQGGNLTTKEKPPAPAETKTAVPAPPKAEETEVPATAEETARSGQMQLSPAPGSFTSAPRADADFSYSLKKDSTERELLPGVTYDPGQGVNIKLNNKQESIQLQRDHTYPTTDYQILWKKKY
jgi:hypothetical protein